MALQPNLKALWYSLGNRGKRKSRISRKFGEIFGNETYKAGVKITAKSPGEVAIENLYSVRFLKHY